MNRNNSNSPIPNSHSKQKIFLVGMPAAGKTYWGRKIAQEYGLAFTDLDEYVAAQEQASISALFATYGEAGFREREHKWLKKVIAGSALCTIIACGGGTPCFSGNIQLMKDHGTVVYLEADMACLLKNLEDDTQVRPLLQGVAGRRAKLEKMLGERKKFYELADHILQVKDISIATFAEMISLCTNRQ